MRRREFLIGGAAMAWPVAVRAQRASIFLVGYLSAQSSTAFPARIEAFRKGLKETGFTENQNLAIEYRFADGRYELLEQLARELVDRGANVIVSTGANASTFAAKSVTSTIPIVFTTGDDPTKLGFVSSLNSPGANITGVSFLSVALGAKRLSLLLDLLPATTSISLLANPASTEAETYKTDIAAAARTLGKQFGVLNASSENEIDVAFASLGGQRNHALVVGSEGLFTGLRAQIIQLAARHSIPTIYPVREYTLDGGLISYGADIADQYRQAGAYAGRILKGERPATMPVALPIKFELIINMKAAKALGISVPLSLQQIADEVIE